MLTGLVNNLKAFTKDLRIYLESDEVIELITLLKREELFNGKRGDGSNITPNYEDRPEFAGWYLEFKNSLDTYRLNDGTPDLYIDGTFHNSLFTIRLSDGVYETDSDYSENFMYEVVNLHDNGTLLDLTEPSIKLVSDEIENYVLSNFNF